MQKRLLLLFFSLILLGCSSSMPDPQNAPEPQVLVFSKTLGYRHASIPDGIAAIQRLGAANHFAVNASEDGSLFNDGSLATYQAVIFLNTTGDILIPDQMSAFQRYIERGGGALAFTRPATRSTTGRGTETWWAPTSTATLLSNRRLLEW
jgi:cytochrome c